MALVRDVDGLNATELAMGLYYLMAYRRGHRGDDPQAEEREHAEAGAEPVSSQLLAELQWYAAHALYFAYDNPVVEVQRQVELQGFRLIFAIPRSLPNKPRFQV